MKRILMLGLLFSGQVSAAELMVLKPWIRLTPPGAKVTAAFMELQNKGEKEVQLVSVTSSDYGTIELHETTMTAGQMKMQKKDIFIIPAKGNFVLKPKSFHLMLFDAKKALKVKDTVTLEFFYKDGSKQSVEVPVKEDSMKGEVKHHHHG